MNYDLSSLYRAFHVRGADCVSFLNGQLTNDCQLLKIGEGQASGYCSAKGKLLATPLLHKVGTDELVVFIHASVAEAWLRRIKMFVLRAKVSFEPALGQLLGTTTMPSAGNALIYAPFNEQLFIVLAPQSSELPTELGTAMAWQALMVEQGVVDIVAGIEDLFIPQAVGLDKRGGVHFRKGCYPGQEVVKRAQTYGQVKKRVATLNVSANMETNYAEIKIATELSFGGQICADVVAHSATAVLVIADPHLTLGLQTLQINGSDRSLEATVVS